LGQELALARSEAELELALELRRPRAPLLELRGLAAAVLEAWLGPGR
jgi:hypothetical protein